MQLFLLLHKHVRICNCIWGEIGLKLLTPCNVRNKPYNWLVSSTTFPNHLFIVVFHHIVSTKPVWFLKTIHTSQYACNQCNQNNGIIFFTAIFHFLFLSHQYLVESLKTWFRRIAAFLVFGFVVVVFLLFVQQHIICLKQLQFLSQC